MSVNKVILVGRVGKDPETKHLEGGTTLSKFPLATNEVYTKNGEKVENTEWHNIIFWRRLAEIAEEYVKKGDLLYIEGRIRTRTYDDQQGVKKYFTEIIGDNLQMLGKKQNDNNMDAAPDTGNNTASAPDNVAEETDDLPF